MTKQILVQNIETFETITVLPNMSAFDTWMEISTDYGIVSLDTDADGEYEYVALVAPQDGPDFVMDMTTGEMETVENIDPNVELEAKMDIMLEMDMNDVPQSEILAMLSSETTLEPTQSKPRKNRKTSKKVKTRKGAKMPQTTMPTTMQTIMPAIMHNTSMPTA